MSSIALARPLISQTIQFVQPVLTRLIETSKLSHIAQTTILTSGRSQTYSIPSKASHYQTSRIHIATYNQPISRAFCSIQRISHTYMKEVLIRTLNGVSHTKGNPDLKGKIVELFDQFGKSGTIEQQKEIINAVKDLIIGNSAFQEGLIKAYFTSWSSAEKVNLTNNPLHPLNPYNPFRTGINPNCDNLDSMDPSCSLLYDIIIDDD